METSPNRVIAEEHKVTYVDCTSTGDGVPIPSLSWYRDDGVRLVPLVTTGTDPMTATYTGDRSHQGQELVCKSDQNGQAPQATVMEARVTIDVTC